LFAKTIADFARANALEGMPALQVVSTLEMLAEYFLRAEYLYLQLQRRAMDEY
jgi:hypothetical protein